CVYARAHSLEYPHRRVARDLHVMETAAVREEHPSFLHSQKDVGDAAAHGHRLSLRIQPVRALHPPLVRDNDHRVRIDLLQYREPGVSALARDGDDVMRDELEDQSDEWP